MSSCQSRWCAATFSTTAASGLIVVLQYSWKLDSSTATTGYGSGSVTTSRIGVPTFPAAMLRWPAAASMAASIRTVVVLPLVPVMASHCCRRPPGKVGRSRQASSTSPITSTPASAALASSGVSGRSPGEVTTRPVPGGTAAPGPSCSGPSRTATPALASRAATSRRSASSRESTAVTWAPWLTSSVLADWPVMPRPATTTGRPARSANWATAPAEVIGLGRQPGGVEDAEPECDAQAADQPEPDHHGRLRPAEHLEMMVQWRHPEHSPAGHLVEAHLRDDGQRDDHEQPAEDGEQQLSLGADGQTSQHAAEGQRAGVAHVDLGRRRIPPQEAETRAEHRRGHHGNVQRVSDLVAGHREESGAVVALLPDADQHIGGEHQDRRPGGQSVEPVGEIYRVRCACDQDDDPDHEGQHADRGPEVAQERKVRVGGREVEAVRVLQHLEREYGAYHHLAS